MRIGSQEGRRRRRVAAAATAIAVAVLAALTAVAGKGERHTRLIISHRLSERHGILFYADFDEAIARDAVSLAPVACHDAPRIPSPSGFARRVLPGRKKSYVLPIPHTGGSRSEATYSMLLAPDRLSGRQDIINAASGLSGMVLYLDGDRIAADFHNRTNSAAASAKWPGRPGEFVHLAVAVSGKDVAIYIDGREACRTALPEPVSLLPRRWATPVNIRFPFSGGIDETAIWNRAITADEARSVSKRGVNLVRHYEPLRYAANLAFRWLLGFGSAAMRTVDRLVPRRGGPPSMRGDFPVLALHTTTGDERHFMRAHEKSLFNGYRTKRAARLRRIDAAFAGRHAAIDAGLDDIYGQVPVCRRPAFLLRGDFPELLGDGGVARLYPPEAHSLIHPGASDILPLSARYVRLYEDRSFKGIYAIEPFDEPGSAWMVRGETRNALYFNGRPKPSEQPPPGKNPEEARADAAAIALADAQFPWSAIELRARRHHHLKKRSAAGFADFSSAGAPVETILGGNLAPMFVTEDLNLSAAGAGVRWESSDPETISPHGEVARPEGSEHRIVTLTAEDCAAGAKQEYRLRVMAKRRTLPSVFVNVGTLPKKEWRCDFTALAVPEDESAPPVRLNGLVGDGCGLRHRGNTAYAKGVKRSMSLKFDKPVAWPDPSHPTNRIIFCSGRADATRLKNKIAFDAFNAAFAPEGFPATRYSHCELFINGEWMGVWEACGSVRDLIPENSLLYKIRSSNPALWRNTKTENLDCVIHPEELDDDPFAPIRELFGFTSTAPSGDFVAGVPSRFHVGNLAGYFVVLNFIDNADGVFMNQYFARLPGDSRFLIIPWDCDETFRRTGRRHSNYLFSRLFKEYPGFAELVCARWREMRAGALSDGALFGRIKADAARLAPYMDEEWRLLKPEGFDGDFAEALGILKKAVRQQLKFMDSCFDAPATAR